MYTPDVPRRQPFLHREHVADRLHSAAIHLLRGVRRVDEAPGLSPARLSALSVVVFTGPVALGTLASAEQVTAPTMTRLVAGLEAEGLVRRDPHPTDGRSVLIRATAKGTRTLQRGRQRRVGAVAEMLSRLSQEELAEVERAVDLVERITAPGA
jgi:DNA-binding MarR family transcriptional regulator